MTKPMDGASCGALWIVQYNGEAVRYLQARCKTWRCAACKPRKQRRLVLAAKAGQPETFMTLTVNPATQGFAGDHARKMIDSWKLLVKRIRRAFPAKRIEYLYVVEATKRGEPHMHVMMRAPFIPQKWLSKTWCELTEAFIVDIRRCNGAAEIANYCAKYAGKAPHHFQGCKRYMMSRAYILNKKPKETDGRWRNVDPLRVQIDGAWIVSVLKDEGWTFEQCSNGFIIAVGGTGPPPFLLSAR